MPSKSKNYPHLPAPGPVALLNAVEQVPADLAEHFENSAAPVRTVRLGFTGRLKSGKDHCAASVGATIHGFAEPLYALCKEFFGTADKDIPGIRATLQTLGQWGRAVVNETYPLTPARAVFNILLRGSGESYAPGFRVNWREFGRNEDIWLNALFARAQSDPSPTQAIVNVRFGNEHARAVSEGFAMFHVMCHPATRGQRLKSSGFTLESAEVNDVSEQLAAGLDRQVLQAIRQQPEGPKLMAVWSDPNVLPPSDRLLTIAEFHDQVQKLRGEVL